MARNPRHDAEWGADLGGWNDGRPPPSRIDSARASRQANAERQAEQQRQQRQAAMQQPRRQQPQQQQRAQQAAVDPALEAAWGASVARADPQDLADDSRPISRDTHGARPSRGRPASRAPADELADAWAAADGRLQQRPDTAESQFYDNRARAQREAATPWADHSSSAANAGGARDDPFRTKPSGRPPSAEFRPNTPWAPDDAMAAADAAAMAAAGRQKKVSTPYATQQSIDGRPQMAAQPRPDSAEPPWEHAAPRRRNVRVMVTPPASPGHSADGYAPRSPYGSPGMTAEDDRLQQAWGASLSAAPKSPPGIQVRSRASAPFAEEPALEAAWAASLGGGGGGGASSAQVEYGAHDVPPWDAQPPASAGGNSSRLGGALPGMAQAEAEDAMAAAWAAGGAPPQRPQSGGPAAPWASHKGARGNTERDPELEAAWAAASGTAAPAAEPDYDDGGGPVVQRAKPRPSALQPPDSPGAAPYASHPGRGTADPALEAAWGASVAPADPRDLADHPPSPARLKHPPKRRQKPTYGRVTGANSRLHRPPPPKEKAVAFESDAADPALEAAWGASVKVRTTAAPSLRIVVCVALDLLT